MNLNVGCYIKDYETKEQAELATLNNYNRQVSKYKLSRALLIGAVALAILATISVLATLFFSLTLSPLIAPFFIIPLMLIGVPLMPIILCFLVDALRHLKPPKNEINNLEYKRDRLLAIDELKNKSIEEIASLKTSGNKFKYSEAELSGFRLLDKSDLPATHKKIRHFYYNAVLAIYRLRIRLQEMEKINKLRSVL